MTQTAMTSPAPQHLQALERANAVRLARAALKRAIACGEVSAADVILDAPWEAESIAFDLGQAAQSLMLAAWDEGIGSAHASVYQEERARDLLAYPAGWRCDTLLSFGYPADPAVLTQGKGPTARRPLGETVHRERW